MGTANINDRASLEKLYSREQFEQDAARNIAVNTSVVHGLLVTSAPDGTGAFSVAGLSRQVGEGDPEGDSLFFIPHLHEASEGLVAAPYGGERERADSEAKIDRRGADYKRFLDRVLTAVRSAEFKTPIGRDDERVKGFRGG